MKNSMKWLVAILAVFSINAVWAAQKAAPAAATPSAAPAAPAAQAAPKPAGPVTGEIVEVIEAKSYTYLRLKLAKGETWAAVPKAQVRKGSTVTIENAMTMRNFMSPSLNRTFDTILFGTLAGSGPAAPAAAAPAAAPAGTKAAAGANPHAGAAATAAAPIKVAKATGADAYTVAEVIGGKGKLKDKAVQIRGQVVKFTGGVMGKNWIHLQDGSGTAAAQTNDVLVTTQDVTKVGDVVLVKGKLGLDRDFGSGYTYPVVVEEAKLTK